METAYNVLTVIITIPLGVFSALVVLSITSEFNKVSFIKWKAICATVLATISIPRAIVAMQLGRDDIIIYWLVVVAFSISAALSWNIYKEKNS